MSKNRFYHSFGPNSCRKTRLPIFYTNNTYRFLQKDCRIVFSSEPSGLTAALDFQPSQAQATLKEIFEYLEHSGKECYIAIDEFQQITDYPEKGVEGLLRSYIQFLPHVHFIFSGRQGTVSCTGSIIGLVLRKEINVSKQQTGLPLLVGEFFWKRSFIEGEGEAGDAIRNYTLFRYMLGCNAYSQWPTKFNGGLFTFDPMYVDQIMEFTPDFRKWGGGTMTAQNQRLVYWPMLKSGDFDLMKSQFDFYLRLLPTAEARTRAYWGHAGACFTEQMENFGLPNPAEYGFKRPASFDKGLEYNAWLEYEWDTVLEFCQMILETARYDTVWISAVHVVTQA